MDFYTALDLVQERYGYTDDEIMNLYGEDMADSIAREASIGDWDTVECALLAIGYAV